MTILNAIQAIIVGSGGVFSYFFVKDYRKNKETDVSTGKQIANYSIGFITNFFDTLGIGSFAPTMAAFKLGKLVPDKLIPGTLNVGDCIPVALEALIFLTVIEVDTTTLVTMVGASIVGAVVGVMVLKNLPEKRVRLTMGVGLLVAATLMLLSKFGMFPAGGTDIGLTGVKLIVAVVGNFILGMLLPLGIGNYAPCMAMVYLLGLNPAIAFPVMMCTGCLVLVTAGIRFAQEGIYHRKAAMGLALGGIPGVFIAAYIVKSLPLSILQWLVICVVIYTGVNMLMGAFKSEAAA